MKFILRIIYFILSIAIDLISSIEDINHTIIQWVTWILTILSICPIPFYEVGKENNLLLKYLLIVFPSYMLITRSHEGIFFLTFYNYLQLWIKIETRKNEEKEQKDQKYKFNLITLFIFVFISYASFFSITDVDGIREFNYPNASRFVPLPEKGKEPPTNLIKCLMMIKTLLPGIFVDISFFEICKLNDYSIIDSLIMSIVLLEVTNIKLFYELRERGSWVDIGMPMAFFIINNIFGYMQIVAFSITYFLTRKRSQIRSYEDIEKGILIPEKSELKKKKS